MTLNDHKYEPKPNSLFTDEFGEKYVYTSNQIFFNKKDNTVFVPPHQTILTDNCGLKVVCNIEQLYIHPPISHPNEKPNTPKIMKLPTYSFRDQEGYHYVPKPDTLFRSTDGSNEYFSFTSDKFFVDTQLNHYITPKNGTVLEDPEGRLVECFVVDKPSIKPVLPLYTLKDRNGNTLLPTPMARFHFSLPDNLHARTYRLNPQGLLMEEGTGNLFFPKSGTVLHTED